MDISVFIAGDLIITQPWSHIDDKDFMQLVDEVRNADVAIANLDMLFHNFKAFHRQTEEGLTWLLVR